MTATDMTPVKLDIATPARRIDLGRLLMVPVMLILLMVNAARLVTTHSDVVAMLGAVLAVAFYALVLWAYTHRSPARATSRHWPSHIAAVLATWLVFAFPLLPHDKHSQSIAVAGDIFLLAGLTWSLWSLRTLGRSFSVLAQARVVVNSGPYRFVRHPLYLGEIISAVGLALNVLSLWSVLTWGLLVGLQLYRSVHEERVLAATLPEYEAYRTSTKRLLPGLV
jgi:protein-S-isoprenylcysteine O-methyltransferase Ste14